MWKGVHDRIILFIISRVVFFPCLPCAKTWTKHFYISPHQNEQHLYQAITLVLQIRKLNVREFNNFPKIMQPISDGAMT